MRDLVKRRPFKFVVYSIGMRSFVASGAAGCVIKPALSNVKNDETPEHFHDQVTKIYYDIPGLQNSVEEADKAVATNEGLAAMGFRRLVFPYRRAWRTSELPDEIEALPGDPCKINRPNAPVGVTHMPNLGVDFIELLIANYDSIEPENPNQKAAQALMERVRAVPFEAIMRNGIKPMLDALVILKENKKIHRDVRLENSMFDPATGTMTLIDFDKMTDLDNFTEFGKWRIPPRLMSAYTPEMALWPSQYTKEESAAVTKYRNDAIQYLLRPDRSFSKIPTRHAEIIPTFAPIVAIWRENQLSRIIKLHYKQRTRPSLQYLFGLIHESDERMSEFLLHDMGSYMDFLTTKNHTDIPVRSLLVKHHSGPTIDSFCMAYCLMVFLGIYLDDEKWATHGATLDLLFKDVLIPLYRFSVYPYNSDQSRANIKDVMGKFTALLPKKSHEASAKEEDLFPLPPSKHEILPQPKYRQPMYRQRNIREMFPPVSTSGKKRGHAPSSPDTSKRGRGSMSRVGSSAGFGSPSKIGGTRKKLKSRRRTRRMRGLYK